MQQNIQEVNSKTNLIHYIRLAQLQFNFKKIIVKYWNWPEFKYNGFFNRNIINAIKHYTEYIEAKHLLEFFLKFLCFLKYSFNANKTHNCIFKMNIIALFLHILWDRKCKVTDSCFRSRDSDLFLLSNGPGFRSPQLTQKWGSAHSLGAGPPRGCTYTWPTHANRQPTTCGSHSETLEHASSLRATHTPNVGENPSVTHLCKPLWSALLITFKL